MFHHCHDLGLGKICFRGAITELDPVYQIFVGVDDSIRAGMDAGVVASGAVFFIQDLAVGGVARSVGN